MGRIYPRSLRSPAITPPKRPPMPLTPGAYDALGLGARSTGRDLFLDALHHHAPEAWDELRAGPQAVHDEIFEQVLPNLKVEYVSGRPVAVFPHATDDVLHILHEVYDSHSGWDAFIVSQGRSVMAAMRRRPGMHITDLVRLRTSLLKWAKRFNLTDTWLLEIALDALGCWGLDEPNAYRRLRGGSLLPLPAPPLAFEEPSWDPFRERRAKARARLLAAAERHIDAHLDEREAHAPGFVPIIPGGMTCLTEHFDWLVWHQVLGMSRQEVANMAGVHRQAIGPTLQKIADLIGLTLRKPDPPGRPRGSSSRRPRRITRW